jgi:signal transduction histidine kinase
VTLRLRLALLIAGAIILAAGAQALFGYVQLERSLAEDLDRDMGQFAALVTAQIQPGSTDFSGVNAVFENYIAKARLVVAGRAVASFGGRFPEKIQAAPLSDPHSVGVWRVVSVALPGYAPSARLDAAISSRDYTAGLERYRRIALLNAVVFALLGVGAATLLARRALLPLDALVRATRRVAASGDLNERVGARGRGELPTLAAAFNAMLERLGAYRQRESEFTNNASHELRSPLAALTLNLSAHREGLQSAEETLAVVNSEVTRMRALTESLLLLARADRADRAHFNLAALARLTAERHAAAYSGPGHVEYAGDPALLRRALENLLENAAKYAPDAAVEVRLEAQADAVRLAVTDGGRGMPLGLLERATRPFERGQTARPGVGLGLSVVERIARVHGGTLHLRNLEPHGLEVVLELPLQSGAQSD